MEYQARLGKDSVLNTQQNLGKNWAETIIVLPHSTRKKKVFLSQQFTHYQK